jgi:hypothetical protein
MSQQNITELIKDVTCLLFLFCIKPPLQAFISLLTNMHIHTRKQVVTAESSRTRQRNYDECLEKLAAIMTEAATEPEERNMNSKTKEKFNANRLLEKKAKSMRKQERRRDYDYD